MKKRWRWDHNLIYNLVPVESSVLDLGCGDGELLARMINDKQVRGQGVEADPACVSAAITNGIPVYQGDLDLGLPEFMDQSFEYVILEKTLQAVRRPMLVMQEMLRIGRNSIVSFPNFSFETVVGNLVLTKRMPVTPSLPYQWHDTPNIHLFTLLDFMDWIQQNGVGIVAAYAWSGGRHRPLRLPADSTRAEELLFVLS
ncbi:MAG: methionine biosynthesis protein MetW [Dethiobacter sp.]|jgi:methionine biosynthesis protein MetW|nr:methionine biosynthesis protein MetW [Dethiobacter sp.]